MRELDRQPPPASAHDLISADRLAIVGGGRMGNALAAALRNAGLQITGPLGRGAAPAPADVDAVLLCVPDAEIAAAAEPIPVVIPIGHCSGATGLEVLAGRQAFSLHPLMTVTGEPGVGESGVGSAVGGHGAAFTGTAGAAFTGAGAAVAGSTPAALELARTLAERLGMRPIEIDPADRAAYHAAASMASNFLVTLEAAAERLAESVGVERSDLAPLVRATVENWARLGPQRALTGPIARGDELTVDRQRQAVADRAPELLDLFEALVTATRALATAGAVAR
jgi:predicted short-subunit dehydrogenase-like oxidoreductase (DUF2520 family)